MIRFIFCLLLLIASVWIGLKIEADPGYALFAYQGWTMEMPLWVAFASTVITFVVLYFVIRLFSRTSSISNRWRKWSQQRRQQRARSQTNRGLIEMLEGNWASAENYLTRSVHKSDTPMINYLAAAKAAQEQQAHERRDDYLRLAHRSTEGAEIAVGLTQALLQLDHAQLEQALATLRHLQSLVPHHAYVLKLLKNIYLKLEDWQSLLELVPDLRKRKIIKDEQITELEIQAYSALLNATTATHNDVEVRAIWEKIPRGLQKNKQLLTIYCKHLINNQLGTRAETLLRDSLKKHWDKDLVNLYGLAASEDAAQQLATAEHWLKGKEQNPALLLCVGRICLRNQLWGKARTYLEASAQFDPKTETYRELGQLLEQLGETENAMECYRKGLQIRSAKQCKPVELEAEPA